MDKQIKEVIIVEGKTDTQKLQSIFGLSIKTIETHGLALSEENLKLIKTINKKVGIIVFTDPDGPGKKIRESVVNYVGGNIKNAFITKQDMEQGTKKIGIAEATPDAIKQALSKLITFNNENDSISWEQYINNDFYLKDNRLKISNHFSFDSNVSSKTLFKWLNWMNLNVEDIKEILGDK